MVNFSRHVESIVYIFLTGLLVKVPPRCGRIFYKDVQKESSMTEGTFYIYPKQSSPLFKDCM